MDLLYRKICLVLLFLMIVKEKKKQALRITESDAA